MKEGEQLLKKSRAAFAAVQLLAVILAAAAALIAPWIALIFLTAFTVWWTLYFRSLKYEITDSVLIIKSGLIMGRIKKIPVSSILRSTAVSLPRNNFLMSVYHTASGSGFVFAELKL